MMVMSMMIMITVTRLRRLWRRLLFLTGARWRSWAQTMHNLSSTRSSSSSSRHHIDIIIIIIITIATIIKCNWALVRGFSFPGVKGGREKRKMTGRDQLTNAMLPGTWYCTGIGTALYWELNLPMHWYFVLGTYCNATCCLTLAAQLGKALQCITLKCVLHFSNE